MNFLIILIGFFWVGRLLVNLLSYIHFWWVKEYRSDRMWIHLRTDQGKRILFLPFRAPPITPKSIALFFANSVSSILLFLLLPGHLLLKLLIIDLLLFPLTWMWVIILSLPTLLYHHYLISQAVKKLRAHAPMKVVGITGSFGKTSTKENLATILSTKYVTLKTENSKNSPIGIAELVLSQLIPRCQVFIVEMGAYKRGEIQQMAHMVRPEAAIITAINPQHQDLFGTLKNTQKAKYELIQSLPRDGIAIFNADNKETLEMAEWAKKEGQIVWLYTKERTKVPDWADKIIRSEDIKAGEQDVAFTVRIGKEKVHTVAQVLGEHQVSNMLAAISGAIAIGMTLGEVGKAVSQIKPFMKTMEPIDGINGSLFINDTFNNNPDAAKAAIDYLSLAKGKKILIFQPMIELGKYAESAHEAVGRHAAQVCDVIMLTNSNHLSAIKRGAVSINETKKPRVLSPKEGAQLLKKMVGKNDTVLFKGKEAENFLKALHV